MSADGMRLRLVDGDECLLCQAAEQLSTGHPTRAAFTAATKGHLAVAFIWGQRRESLDVCGGCKGTLERSMAQISLLRSPVRLFKQSQ